MKKKVLRKLLIEREMKIGNVKIIPTEDGIITIPIENKTEKPKKKKSDK